jgi:hypothetical protein
VSFDYLANLRTLKNFFEGWTRVRKSLIEGYGREKKVGNRWHTVPQSQHEFTVVTQNSIHKSKISATQSSVDYNSCTYL